MALFIDGYNLIFSAAARKIAGFDAPTIERKREALLRMLASYRTVRSERIVVFFDGGPDAAHLPRRMFQHGIDVVFSDAQSDADTEIKNAVSHDFEPQNILVVSSDNEIQTFVRRAGCRVMEAREFLAEVLDTFQKSDLPSDEPPEKYEGQAGGDIEYWLRVFGDGKKKAD